MLPCSTTDRSPRSVTRGFFFSDLRGYTEFVEAHGAAAAAELLGQIGRSCDPGSRRYGGEAVSPRATASTSSSTPSRRAALRVADDHGGPRHAPLRAAVVGPDPRSLPTSTRANRRDPGRVRRSPVNIAARICSKAGAGEVLVSETVRALTRTLLPVEFQPRGRPNLKGVAEPMALYRVVETPGRVGAAPVRRRTHRSVGRRTVLAGGAVLAGAVLLAGGGMLLTRPGPGACRPDRGRSRSACRSAAITGREASRSASPSSWRSTT